MVQYKQQILSYIEYRSPAIYHATTSVLGSLDKCQDFFLREIGISKETALLELNLAPLSMRRDIALLGVIHRAALRKGPPQFWSLFTRRTGSLQVVDSYHGQSKSLLIERSIWGLIEIYNKLGGIASGKDVKSFQTALQARAKRVVAKRLLANWSALYSPR